MLRVVRAAILAATLSGCLHSAVTVSPATKPLAPGGYKELRPATGVDCLWALFGVIPISSGNTLQNAMREAIENGGGDALIQVTADTFFQHYIIVSRYCTQVEGIGVDSRQVAAR
jgi:hypothetical protein